MAQTHTHSLRFSVFNTLHLTWISNHMYPTTGFITVMQAFITTEKWVGRALDHVMKREQRVSLLISCCWHPLGQFSEARCWINPFPAPCDIAWRPWPDLFYLPVRRHGTPCLKSDCLSNLRRNKAEDSHLCKLLMGALLWTSWSEGGDTATEPIRWRAKQRSQGACF